MTDLRPPISRPPSTNELEAALQDALNERFGAACQVVRLDRRPSAYRTSFALEELDIELQDGTTHAIMFKDLSLASLLPAARAAKPDFLYDPLREIAVYRDVLAPHDVGPAWYGAAVDRQADRYWLFVERVPGIELYQVGELAIWQEVARWLALLHDNLAGEVGALVAPARLLRYERDWYRAWIRRAQTFVRRREPELPSPGVQGLDRVAMRYQRVIDRLETLPHTFIHGELFASNVLVQERPGSLRVCPVDWELAAIAPGLIDLAALIAGSWSKAEKEALSHAYRSTSRVYREWNEATFIEALDCCRLHVAVQWLGWSSNWTPPREHAQDWLGEALDTAERLRL